MLLQYMIRLMSRTAFILVFTVLASIGDGEVKIKAY